MGTEDLSSHLPATLRFARGLTRSKREGEALVETALKALLEGSASLDHSLTLPSALFECVHRSWIPVDAPRASQERPGVAEPANPVYTALSRVAPPDRAALLLVRFEGLSAGEAARVLHISEAETRRRLTQAERRLLRQPHPRVLIIDEDSRTAGELQDLVTGLDCEVVGPVPPRRAVGLAASQTPDLIVAATMAASGESGINAVEAICRHRDTPVIFVTDAPDRLFGRRITWRECLTGTPLDREAAAAQINRALGRGSAC